MTLEKFMKRDNMELTKGIDRGVSDADFHQILRVLMEQLSYEYLCNYGLWEYS